MGTLANGPCCAHINLKYAPLKNQDGSYSSRWECQDCNSKFWISGVAEHPSSPREILFIGDKGRSGVIKVAPGESCGCDCHNDSRPGQRAKATCEKCYYNHPQDSPSPEPEMTAEQFRQEPDPKCPKCHGTGGMDSGATSQWGAAIEIVCDCAFRKPMEMNVREYYSNWCQEHPPSGQPTDVRHVMYDYGEYVASLRTQALQSQVLDMAMLLKAVLAKKGDLHCLRDKIRDYLERKGLTSVLR